MLEGESTMKWNIVADSAIELFNLETPNDQIEFHTIPFIITVGNREYIDDESLNYEAFIEDMRSSKEASHTACPSVDAWYRYFKQEGPVFAITITSKLSGSYNSACAARTMVLEEEPDKQIEILDSLSTGPSMVLILRRLCELIEAGHDFETVVEEVHKYMKLTRCCFALSSFDNLIKNGRMNRVVGCIANKLSLIGIGIASEKGTIEIKKEIARGRRKAVEIIVNDMRQRGTLFKDVVISHCQNLEFATQVRDAIKAVWDETVVTIIPCRGLCSYYAEYGGLIIAF